MSENDGGKGGGFFTGFIFGGIVGALVAYFITQEDARDAIVGKAREAGNRAAGATGDLRGRVADAATSLQANAADLYARGKTVVDNARSNINAAVDEGQNTSEQLREDLSRESQSQFSDS